MDPVSTNRPGLRSRSAVCLIEHGAFGQVRDEAGRIGASGGARHVVVEADIAVAQGLADAAGQCRLAALTRAVDQDDRRILKGFAQGLLSQTRVVVRRIHRLIVTLSSG